MAMIAFCVSLYIIVVFVHFGLSFVHICFIDVVVPRLPIRILCDLGVGKEKLHFNLLNKEMTENIFEKKNLSLICVLGNPILFSLTLIPCTLTISLYISKLFMIDIFPKCVILSPNSNPNSLL